MALFGIKIQPFKWVQDRIDDITGERGVQEAKRAARRAEDVAQEWLEMARVIFDASMAAVERARAAGVFDTAQIFAVVERNVSIQLNDLAARGLIAGAKPGDTVQAQRIAKAAIAGGRALADVPFIALQREQGALNQVPIGAFGSAAGGAIGAINQGAARVAAARSAQLGQLKDIIDTGIKLNLPQFRLPGQK